MLTFIKRYLFDDSKLRDRALLELTRGLRDGRIIALTGSMATEALGYFDWPGLCEAFAGVAETLKGEVGTSLAGWATADRRAEKLLQIIGQHCALLSERPQDERRIDVRVHFNVVREAFDALDDILVLRGVTRSSEGAGHKPLREQFNERFAERFQNRPGAAKPSPIKPLIENLGITRFVTLNYDFELERALMLRADERETLRPGAANPSKGGFNGFVGPPEAQRQITLDPIKRMSRTRGDGLSVDSDVLNRERVDRLIEFAVGSANVDYHLLHLHGRADEPPMMVVDIRDYDRLYRRDDLFKNPFEHGLRVLFAGNPVLFVGVGMSEAEINATLQDFVSNSPYRRTAPAFLLWNTTSFSVTDEKRHEEKRLRRLDFLQRLGVYVIFDDDILWKSDPQPDEYRRQMAALKEREEDAATPEAERGDIRKEMRALALEALRAMVAELPGSIGEIERHGGRVGDGHWRNMEARSHERCGRPVRQWGTPLLASLAASASFAADGDGEPEKVDTIVVRFTRIEDASTTESASTRLMSGMSAPGFGRGLLAEWLVQKAPNTFGEWQFDTVAEDNRLLVNAGFSYDSDALLSGIADFLWARNQTRTKPRPCREVFFATGAAFDTRAPTLVILNGVDRFFGFDGAPLSAELDHLLRCIIAPENQGSQVQWLLLGTERLTRYLGSLGQPTELLSAAHPPVVDETRPETLVDSRYLAFVARRFREEGRTIGPAAYAKLSIAHHTSRDALRRAFFSAFLSPVVLGQAPVATPPKTATAPPTPRMPSAAQPSAVDGAASSYDEALTVVHAGDDAASVTSETDASFTAKDARGVNCALAFEILRAMAFIGWPVEVGVLVHVPRVAALIGKTDTAVLDIDLLTDTIEQLRTLGLLIEIARFDAECHTNPLVDFSPTDSVGLESRFGLHRALATELRERHGVPLSEAKLSSTFNMSLFAAQPADDYTPEPQFHDELGNLVDRLIGAWKDPFDHGFAPALVAATTDHDRRAVTNHPTDQALGPDDFAKICSPRAVACLRAALAVIRGYYSTSNLLSIDLNDRLASVTRDGALTEHSDRLDRLLKGFGKIATARETMRAAAARNGLQKQAADAMGAEPFYPDDLVWLHNERGVVKLAQGDLYGARRSFSLALRMNNSYVERNHKGHNWRRITLNMIGVLIERGRLRSADTQLDEIEASINQAAWAATTEASQSASGSRFARILDIYGSQEGFIDDCSSEEFTREEILMVGLVTGYRGLIGQNRGQEKTAKGLYERSISILRRLAEQRSYALFQRHYASLRQIAQVDSTMRRQVDLAIAAADAAHQMDMSYRARLLRADLSRRTLGNAHERKAVLADIHRALRYAALTDSYRVRIEASSSLARMMLESGEFDTALKHACDAMAVASRFGHSLHKVALRVQIGDILIQRGDPKSGGALLDEALSLSSRMGYYRIVERVQRARRSESSLMSAANFDRG